ncbi:MAG: S9 family peptidase, partial [Cyanobacteria bacterium J06576_12]
PIDLPSNARIRNLQWSYSGEYLAFTLTSVDDAEKMGVSLWVLDMEKGEARSLTGPILNDASGGPLRWLPDHSFICKVRVESGLPPSEPAIPIGPIIEENLGRVAPARTYTNLLENPHDEALLEYYLTSALVHVSLEGTQTQLTEPDLFRSVSVSPDGEWIKVSTNHRPFSYQVPLSRFPRRTEILDRQGKSVYAVADLPLAEEISINFDSVRPGKRATGWRADKPATLYWVEALDGGDAREESEYRDAVYTLSAPFIEEPQLFWRSNMRYNGLVWGNG